MNFNSGLLLKISNIVKRLRVSIFIFFCWLIYMLVTSGWHHFESGWFMSVTMVFGSFIAGASSEGGGAFAFPVMTLVYNISPGVARNFSLSIQSVGMTAASLFIILNKYTIEKNYLLLCSLGGFFGIILGTFFVVPLVSPAFVKMLFFSFWLSFAFVLYYLNHVKKRKVIESLHNLKFFDKIMLIVMGISGGVLTSVLGTGIDIFTFSFVTLRYDLSEKVATPTSVIIMAVNSIIGFVLHSVFIGDYGVEEFNYWIVCVPVVIFFAPLGAYVVNVLKRINIVIILYIIIVSQFIGALYIIRPAGSLLVFTIAVFFSGIFIFLLSSREIRLFNKSSVK